VSASEGAARQGSAWCPRCFLSVPIGSEACGSCGLPFLRTGGVLDVIGHRQRESRAAEVEDFYTDAPFPGYAPGDTAATLLDRSRRSSFLCALDAAVPADGRFLSVGCGTAQVPAFLALAGPRRKVVGVDGCEASLGVADAFAGRVGIENLQLVRGDLFDLPIEPASYDVVSCRGVVHHTPDPWRAVECVARCVAPGGVLLLGYYETMGRAWHGVRQLIARLRGKPARPIWALDPVLRRRDLDTEKKRIWIEDQYRHPLERWMATPKVFGYLDRLGFEWVRTVPPSPGGDLFEGSRDPGPFGLWRRRMGWMLAGIHDPDAGLVFVVVRRRSAEQGS
jgi:SAM-dependent methyltransferase